MRTPNAPVATIRNRLESSLLRSTPTRWDGREVASRQFSAGVWHALALRFGRLIANPRLALETPCFGDLCT